MKRKPLWIFLTCYCGYLFLYISRSALTMAAPELKALALLTTEQIGLLGSLFSITYACGRLISGRICDRVIPWKVIGLGLLLCGVSTHSPDFPAHRYFLLHFPGTELCD